MPENDLERHDDARPARPLDEREVVGVVVEELGDDQIETGVDLRLQVRDAEVEIPALGMALGVAGADEAETRAPLAYEADEIGSVAEAICRTMKVRVLRDVAAQRHHVLDAVPAEEVEHGGDLAARRLDPRDVRRRLDAERADTGDEVDRRLPRLAIEPAVEPEPALERAA